MSAKTYHFKGAPVQALAWTSSLSTPDFVEFLGGNFHQWKTGPMVCTTYRGYIAIAVGDYAIKVTIPLESGNLTIVDVVSMGYFHDHFIDSGDVLM